MHGVGWELMDMVSRSLHELDLIPCTAQQHPHPDFPTVKFPNPEETGALDLALKEADKNSASLVLANDPDADRFAAACKMPNGKWHQFTGDELGVLLASFLMDFTKTHSIERQAALICTAVSSSMMSKMIDRAGQHFRFDQTLTGFKWIGNRADDLSKQGISVLFGYEEALGYMFPDVSLDKDGIAAASCFISAAKSWALKGLSPYQKLVELYKEYGWHDSINTYFTSSDASITKTLFDSIRASEELSNLKFGELAISRWRDVTTGKSFGDWPFTFIDAGSQMLAFTVNDTKSGSEASFTLRASGTEPKIKIYLESAGPDSTAAQRMSKYTFETLVRVWIRRAQSEIKHSGRAISSLGQTIDVPA
ncbi:MAG: hypothetical protein Q9160_001815 [Pyrenula sp. 1 TL-2023]